MRTLILALASVTAFASTADAQRRRVRAPRASKVAKGPRVPMELHGSKASVEKMYAFARSHGMPFYLTQTNVDTAIARGQLVDLSGGTTYELTRGVGFSYATRETRAFVSAFAQQYLTACGVPLTVTSAARPMNRQPRNANPHSVHPAGIAIDIRRPPSGPCLTWVRSALSTLEAQGTVEATEEKHPVHLHVAVLVTPGRPVALPRLTAAITATPPVVLAKNAATIDWNSGGARRLR